MCAGEGSIIRGNNNNKNEKKPKSAKTEIMKRTKESQDYNPLCQMNSGFSTKEADNILREISPVT